MNGLFLIHSAKVTNINVDFELDIRQIEGKISLQSE